MPNGERIYQHRLPGHGAPVEVSRFGGSVDSFYRSVRGQFSSDLSENGEFTETRAVFDKEGKKPRLLIISGDYISDESYYDRMLFVKVDRVGKISGTQLLLEHDKTGGIVTAREIDIRGKEVLMLHSYFAPSRPIVDGEIILGNEVPEMYIDPEEDLHGVLVDDRKLNNMLRNWGIGVPPPELRLLKRPEDLSDEIDSSSKWTPSR